MRSVIQKLKSKSGVSMIAALLFLLLCAMVGGVVLTAASVSAGKVQRDRAAYQKTLAVASAAKLLQEDLQGLKFTGVYQSAVTTTTRITPQKNDDGTDKMGEDGKPLYTTTVSETDPVYAPVPSKTGFGDTSQLLKDDDLIDLKDMFYQSVDELPGGVPVQELSCKLEFPENADYNIPAVVATLTIDKNDLLTAELALAEEPDKTIMYLTAKGVRSGPTVSTAKGEAVTSGNVTEQNEITTYTVTITWPQARIEEGSAS